MNSGRPRIREWFFQSSTAFADLNEDARITHTRFSGDGSSLYTATEQAVSAWQLPLPGELSVTRRKAAADLTKKLTGQYIIEYPATNGSGKDANTITICEAESGSRCKTISLGGRILTALISQDGTQLAVMLATGSTRGGNKRSLEIWDTRTEKRIAERPFKPLLDTRTASYLGYAGGDRFLVVGARRSVEILETEGLTFVASLYHRGVTLTAMNGDGTFAATTGTDGIVRIWEMATRNEIARIESEKTVQDLTISNEGRWLATLDDVGTVRLWALTSADLIQQVCKWVAEPCP